MLIECIIKRKDGTQVTLDEVNYHFKPSAADQRHLAEVMIQAHAERFLAITEGYRDAGQATLTASQQRVADSRMPRTSISHSAFYDIGDKRITLQELTLLAQKESGLDVAEWNAQDDQDLHEQLDTALEELRDAQAEAEELAKGNAPQRGNVLQPAPQQGLEDPEEDEKERLAVEAEMARLAAESKNVSTTAQQSQGGEPSTSTSTETKPEAADGTAKVDATGTVEANEKTEEKAEDPGSKDAGNLPTRDELVAAYKEKMGRAPSSRLSDERIHQLLTESDE